MVFPNSFPIQQFNHQTHWHFWKHLVPENDGKPQFHQFEEPHFPKNCLRWGVISIYLSIYIYIYIHIYTLSIYLYIHIYTHYIYNISYHIISYQFISYHIMSYHIVNWMSMDFQGRFTMFFNMLNHVEPCWTMLNPPKSMGNPWGAGPRPWTWHSHAASWQTVGAMTR